ncbi:relaxase/mobilization nuclease domain-containing protein [Chakrabartyella piscis]|uniref:relaxase/mobilization nuclease domain-containing protein n=1 Tax=Chakrabartyella piscis TaxID=2918914 RepID=UPI00295845FA|nr:relaxase/mobilization nuclease domain-containing protein [Chakrabartyella piscis]
MATVNFINRKKSQSRAGLRVVLNYTMQDKKTEHDGNFLVGGMNCTPHSVYEEFINTKLLYGKDDGRMYYHFVQSFPKDEVISPTTAHEIALKLAEHYNGFEVLVATHTDREHIHSHFIINSVNFETGKKLHQSAQAIPEIRQKSDELCMQFGLSICKPKQDRTKVKAMTIGEYHMALKGKNWKLQLANIIDECMKYAYDKESFISLMESEGIKVKWTDSRKNITYELGDGKKCRDSKLYEEKYLKERVEKEFATRREIINGRAETTEFANEKTVHTATDNNERFATDIGKSEGLDGSNRDYDTQSRGELWGIDIHETNTKEADDSTRFEKDRGTISGDEQDDITGWETQRAFFFSSENQLAYTGMDTNVYHSTNAVGHFGSDLLQLGKAMERITNDVPVTHTPKSVTDKNVRKKMKEKKIALGQKADDHEESQSGMTMGGY